MRYTTEGERHQAHLESMKKWRARNKKHTRKYDAQPWRRANHRAYIKKQYNEMRAELFLTIGKQCVFCKHSGRIYFHEIHGKPHLANMNGLTYMRKHADDFVPLCYNCHKAVHWCMKFLQMEWKEIFYTFMTCNHRIG